MNSSFYVFMPSVLVNSCLAVYEYRKICEWMKLEDMGILTAHGSENKSEAKLKEAYELGKSCAND